MDETQDEQERIEAEALLAALVATSRKAANAGPVPEDALASPVLRALAHRALSESLGPERRGPEPFPLTIWRGGAGHVGKPVWVLGGQVVPEGTPGATKRVSPGVKFQGSIDTFISVLRQRAAIVCPKKSGWVVEPTTNKDGQRTNESTTEMHAVFLDCDGCGEWDETLAGLAEVGLAHLAYQSSGWSEFEPKWRVVLPLCRPFPVRDDRERGAWKRLYHRVRALVGALGRLKREGFDPRTDAPSAPWFLCERRSSADPWRKVQFHPGRSLDATALAMSLPIVDEGGEEETRAYAQREVGVESSERMTDKEHRALVSALAEVTNQIPRGRRDLYLALPGALLDRGVHPDDVISVCEEVSARYPRKHADKHRDNVHGAKTTVRKFHEGGIYIRIGVLQSTHPDVAAVVDRFFPDPVEAELRMAVSEGTLEELQIDPSQIAGGFLAPRSPVEGRPIAPRLPEGASTEAAAAAPVEKPKRDPLRARIEKLATEWSEDKRRAAAGLALKRAVRHGIATLLDPSHREVVLKGAIEHLGFEMGTGDRAVSFEEVLASIGGIGRVTQEEYRQGAESYGRGAAGRRKWDAEAPARLAKKNEEEARAHVEFLRQHEERRRAWFGSR